MVAPCAAYIKNVATFLIAPSSNKDSLVVPGGNL